MPPLVRRRAVTAATAALLLLTACGAPDAGGSAQDTGGEVPAKPGKAVTLNILDVAGNL